MPEDKAGGAGHRAGSFRHHRTGQLSMKKPAGTAKPSVEPKPPAVKEALPETTEGFPWASSHDVKKDSNPFTDRDWRMFIYAWSGMLVRFAVIFTLMFSVYQFLANQEQKRVEQTMSLVEL